MSSVTQLLDSKIQLDFEDNFVRSKPIYQFMYKGSRNQGIKFTILLREGLLLNRWFWVQYSQLWFLQILCIKQSVIETRLIHQFAKWVSLQEWDCITFGKQGRRTLVSHRKNALVIVIKYPQETRVKQQWRVKALEKQWQGKDHNM